MGNAESMVIRYAVRLAIGLALGLSLAGCSGEAEDNLPRQAVWGNVTLDDKPLERGSITFTPADVGQPGAVSTGALIVDGSYSIGRDGGPTPGKYRVAILGSEAAAAPAVSEAAGPTPRRSAARKNPTVPEEYNARSILTAEVKADTSNTFNYDMKKK
jgi:hypothetical protein